MTPIIRSRHHFPHIIASMGRPYARMTKMAMLRGGLMVRSVRRKTETILKRPLLWAAIYVAIGMAVSGALYAKAVFDRRAPTRPCPVAGALLLAKRRPIRRDRGHNDILASCRSRRI